MSGALAFAAVTQGTNLVHLVLVVSRACICTSHRNVANNKVVLDQLFPRAQQKGSCQRDPTPNISLRDPICMSWGLQPEGQAFSMTHI